jgi:hypothetical protein
MRISPSQFDAAFSATQQFALGQGYRDANNEGRVFHYAEMDVTGVGRGKLAVAATIDSQRVNLSFASAPAIGATSASVTIGTGNASADDFKDGWLVVQDGTGEGRAYPIEGHAAITASTAGTFYLKEAIDTAGAISETNVDLIKNLYKDVQISVTDQADPAVGVPVRTGTANYYGWVQTWGPCAVWFDEAVAVGLELTIGTGTAGQVEAYDGAGEQTIAVMGPTAGVGTEYQLVYLKLDPTY